MQPAGLRPLTRPQRAMVYALLGWATEVAFTSVAGVVDGSSRDWRLRGHSYLWMGPIYALIAFLYEPLHDRLRARSRWQRASAYAAGFLACELATGAAIRRAVGLVPWDYTSRSRLTAGRGVVRLDYAPLWAIAGLAAERLDDTLRGIELRMGSNS